LICDDVEAIRVLLRAVIETTSTLYVAGEAADGNVAIIEAKRLQPDVILLDLSMPGRTGLDALPDLRMAAPGAEIIVFSGLADSVVEEETLKAGATRFLQKGVDPETIVAAIEDSFKARAQRPG
jgi:DNA-binding NarL/FixJ family response regulator